MGRKRKIWEEIIDLIILVVCQFLYTSVLRLPVFLHELIRLYPVLFVCFPIVSGQYAFRKYLIEHNAATRFPDIAMIENYLGKDLVFPGFTYGQIILINIGICIVFIVAAFFFVRWMTKVARRRGTIEFY